MKLESVTHGEASATAVNEAALLRDLRERLGANHVLADADTIAPYLVEDRGLYRGRAIAVARPASVEEVVFIIEQCRAHQLPIVPQGGNTGMVGGGVPQGGIVLAMERLNCVREIDPVNATITVEAGCVLRTVQEAAAEVGRLFPLSLASEGSCQIGGNLATNAGGTNVLRYGNARELVLGLEVVLPNGQVLNDLNGLRKNNTGYDLKNLFIGSEGTLGIITAATLKLFPKLHKRAASFVGCASPHHALRLFDRLHNEAAGEALTAFEYMPRFALETVLKHTPSAVSPFEGPHDSYVLIELSSPDPAIDLNARLEMVLGDAFEAGIIEDAVIGASEAQNQALWHLRERISEAQKGEGGSIKHDVSVPVSRLADFITRASDACLKIRPDIRICAFGHFGDGNLHFNITQPPGMKKEAFLEYCPIFNRAVHDTVAEMKGSISAEHGIGLVKREELQHYKDPTALTLMRTLKSAIDPDALFNPGKVI